VKECVAAAGEEVYRSLVEQGRLRPLSAEVVFLPATCAVMEARIVETLRRKGSLTVSETRDLFGSSRKYILAVPGDLDARGVTR
jgi:selenocysteine-specific elongation factor